MITEKGECHENAKQTNEAYRNGAGFGCTRGDLDSLGENRAEAVIAIIRTTGMFSLAQGQATSAQVVNTLGGDERQIVVSWTVFDSSGNILARSDEQTVLPGQSANFEYGTGVYSRQRTAIRLVLRVEGAARNRNSETLGPDDLIATQEVYNIADGRTTVFLPYVEQ